MSSSEPPCDARPALRERQVRLEAAPMLHVGPEGGVLGAWGEAVSWSGVAEGLDSVFGEHDGELILERLRLGVGVEELRPRLASGRRVALAAWPCEPGWLLDVHDVTCHGQLQEAATHRERLRALASFAGAVARELNDPMAIVQGRLELLLAIREGTTESDPVQRHLAVALDHARRISATLRNLRMVGLGRELRLERVQLLTVLHQSLELVGPRRERVRLVVEPPDLAVGGEAALYTRVFSHILRLAVEGSSRGDIECRARREGKQVVVLVRLDSPRTSASTSRAEDSTDLTIDHTLLGTVGARMEAFRVAGAPAFHLHLPLAPATRERPRAGSDPLLVVGEMDFTDTVQQLLDKDGYAFETSDGGDALARVGDLAPVAVVSDLLLPGRQSGLALGQAIARVHPDLRGRLVVVADAPLQPVPAGLTSVTRPLSRAGLLDALGRRVRHR